MLSRSRWGLSLSRWVNLPHTRTPLLSLALAVGCTSFSSYVDTRHTSNLFVAFLRLIYISHFSARVGACGFSARSYLSQCLSTSIVACNRLVVRLYCLYSLYHTTQRSESVSCVSTHTLHSLVRYHYSYSNQYRSIGPVHSLGVRTRAPRSPSARRPQAATPPPRYAALRTATSRRHGGAQRLPRRAARAGGP